MPKQQSQGLASRRNLEKLQLELSSIKQGVQSHELGQGNNGTWGFLRYGIGEENHDQAEADGPEFDKGEFANFFFSLLFHNSGIPKVMKRLILQFPLCTSAFDT